MKARIRIGSRGSKLALWQANWVKGRIESLSPGLAVEILTIKTTGDKILDAPLAKIGGKGLFVKEIEEALLGGEIDLAVHSMKDMPAVIPAGLKIAAVPEREDVRDALVSRGKVRLDDLPRGAKVGTTSLRRRSQLLALRPDLEVQMLRGNLDTRVRRVEEGAFDAAILALAGLKRMGLDSFVSEVIPVNKMLPAVGQGALCIEARVDDPEVLGILAPLDHGPSRLAVTAERGFLARLGGGCQVPIGGHATHTGRSVVVRGLVARPDASEFVRGEKQGPTHLAEKVGRELAEDLLSRGAGRLLEELEAGAGLPGVVGGA